MSLDTAPFQSLLRTLNLGSFPKQVAILKDSSEFFDQFVFVDYELQLTLKAVTPGALFNVVPESNSDAKISSLINFTQSVTAKYASTDKSYLEVYYASVVLAHLHVLSGNFEAAISTLNDFRIDHSVPLKTDDEKEFMDYISARFHGLLGKASHNSSVVWGVFLGSLKRYGNSSQVSANIWIDTIFDHYLSEVSSNGKKPLLFKDFLQSSFSSNVCSLVALGNSTFKVENERFLSSSFRQEYVAYISELLDEKIKQKKDFPDAREFNSVDIDFVQSFYQTLNRISTHRQVVTYFVKPKLSKRFLVNMTEKTYQSQSVVYNLVLALIDLGEYDEAMAAFKTFVSYAKRDKVQTGRSSDILQIISLYSICILLFNPINSFIPDAKSPVKRFKYLDMDTVIHELTLFEQDLLLYLEEISYTADLSYEDDLDDSKIERLSFLYHKYNQNILLDAKSTLISLLSAAWSALGKYHQYLACYGAPDVVTLKEHKDKVMSFCKNSLIANPNGNLNALFDYALTLAYEHHVTEGQTLCKFILKRYPESFKTWNLLVLLMSAARNQEAAHEKLASASSSRKDVEADSTTQLASYKNDLNGPEKFIEDALNVASIYISKHHDSRTAVSVETKYAILQLKMTQLAVWEAEYGVNSILESIADVFALYHELFLQVKSPKMGTLVTSGGKPDGKWSKRPTVIDANDTDEATSKPQLLRHVTKDKMKKLSRLSIDSLDKKQVINGREEKENKRDTTKESRILQDIWLWCASIYLKLGYLEEAEQCIVEAETADKPNVKTYTYLGILTSRSRKHLALQEFERSFEILHSAEEKFSVKTYGLTLLGMSSLIVPKSEDKNSLFISEKDRDAGLVRMKNYLETFSNSWPYGHNSPEIWYYLSSIYEEFDDKILQSEALWKCVDLEMTRPVRSYDVCEDFTL